MLATAMPAFINARTLCSVYCSPADLKQCQSTDAKANGEQDAHGLQRKHLVTTALHPDRREELLNSHCRGHNRRYCWEIQCSCLKVLRNSEIRKAVTEVQSAARLSKQELIF